MAVALAVTALAQVAGLTETLSTVGGGLGAVNTGLLTGSSHPPWVAVHTAGWIELGAAQSSAVTVGFSWTISQFTPISRPPRFAGALMRGRITQTVTRAVLALPWAARYVAHLAPPPHLTLTPASHHLSMEGALSITVDP